MPEKVRPSTAERERTHFTLIRQVCVAVWCTALQCVAVFHCSVLLQCVAVVCCSVLRLMSHWSSGYLLDYEPRGLGSIPEVRNLEICILWIPSQTSTWADTPKQCNALHHTATHCNVHADFDGSHARVDNATHCNSLQHYAAHIAEFDGRDARADRLEFHW